MTTPPVLDYTRQVAPILVNRERAQAVAAEARVDVLLATSPANVAYLSGYYCMSHWTIVGTLAFAALAPAADAGPAVVAPAMELDAWAEEPVAGGDIWLYGKPADVVGRTLGVDPAALTADDQVIHHHGFAQETPATALDALVAALTARGHSRATIALDESGVSYSVRQAIADRLPDARLVDGAGLFKKIRMVKTAVEVECLTEATRVAGRALHTAAGLLEPGVLERDVWRRYNTEVAEQGGLTTFAVVNFGRRSGHTHNIPSDYRLRSGDVVKFDVGCSVRMYQADIGRTMVVGEPTEEMVSTYRALLVGQQATIAVLRPGVRPSEVFATAVEAVRDAGLPGYQRHHVGHGIGLDVYDMPVLQPSTSSSEFGGAGRDDEPLEANMVFCVETPYYVLGSHGMIVEDTVVVTPGGARYLTDLPRDLI
ncbi:M24 family metallopeptidase [Plantactinospora sp. GCM10030261]|uniref:M24 family metallopeptidase n=1 Tax=Plantactinospora sp. GCM10030261 TaxID=3273420 RepID=UPI00360C3688